MIEASSLSWAAQGNVIEFDATLSGANEAIPNASPGTGSAAVFFDTIAQTLRVDVTFSGLTSGDTASHIHAATSTAGTGTAGVATSVPTFTGFPTGVTSGTYDHTFDLTLLTSYNPSFVTANGGTASSAEAALVAALMAGKSYLNIHTTEFPSGEIRGFLTQNALPPFPCGEKAVRTGGIRRGTAPSQNHENKIMTSHADSGRESAPASVGGEGSEQERERVAGGAPGAGAVPPYQGRCLLMILYIRPVTAAVTESTFGSTPHRGVSPGGKLTVRP